MTESAYADDAAFIFPYREIAERDTPRIMKHCAEWEWKITLGSPKPQTQKAKHFAFRRKTLSHQTHQSLSYNFK